MASVTLDTDAPGWLADPYPQYRALRESGPVHWSGTLDHWVLTRHRHVLSALKDTRLSAANRPPQRRWGRPTTMVTSDPPDHSRLRKPVNQRFTASGVDALRVRIQEVVNDLLDRGVRDGRIEIVSALSRPLPDTIIREMLGLETNGEVVDGRRAGGMATGTIIPSDSYFLDALERHRAHPADDLLGDLVATQEAGAMNEEEALDTAQILYAAGQETTAKMISNALYYLLRHPDQLDKLRRNTALLPNAVEELLRFDTPVHAISRKAIEDVEIDGQTVARGDKVLLLLAAANRDPDVFEAPEVLDIERDPNPHLTFGTGVHMCLGAGLARAEIEASLRTLLARYPDMRLANQDVSWEGGLIIRGLRRLEIEVA
jgi:cytochrome P450